jgi:hypothetical protein
MMAQPRVVSGYIPPQSKSTYDRTPKNLEELSKRFLHIIQIVFIHTHREKDKNKINLQETCREYGICDPYVTKFFQKIGLLKKTGKAKGTKWFWLADVKPTPMVATDIARKYKNWKKGFKCRPFPEKTQSHISPITPPYNDLFTSGKEEVAPEPTEVQQPKKDVELHLLEVLDQMIELITLTRKRNKNGELRWKSLTEKLDKMERNIQKARFENAYVQFTILFGLIKFNCPIKFNVN